MLVDMSLKNFSQELASDSPAPGGGSVAALSGALGADLVAMVCRLTQDKSGYESHQELIAEALQTSESLSASLLESVDSDTRAFNGVIAAFKMKKNTAAEKTERSETIQKGYKDAVNSPLAIATDCLAILRVVRNIYDKCNVQAISDVGVASQQAYAGLQGGIMNIKINLPSIKDEKFGEEMTSQCRALLEEADKIHMEVRKHVSQQLTSCVYEYR